MLDPPRGEFILHEIEIRRLVVTDGIALVFVFTSAFSLSTLRSRATAEDGQPSTFTMTPSVMDLSRLGNGEKDLPTAKAVRPTERER
jgi:hypothetical protein